jgi:hypothetical protein
MSIRTNQHCFECKECLAKLVLIAHEMTCPKCSRLISGLPHDETLFYENAISTMSFYKRDHGFYRPLAFYVGSWGDMMLSVTYQFFDFLEQENPADEKEFLDDFIKKLKLDDDSDEYLRKHYHDAISTVLVIYLDPGIEKYLEEKFGPREPIKRKSSWFQRLIS